MRTAIRVRPVIRPRLKRLALVGSCAVLVVLLAVLAVVAVMLHPPSGWTSDMTTGSPFSEEETRGLAGVCDVG